MPKGKHQAGKHTAPILPISKQNTMVFILVLSSIFSLSLITCFGMWMRGQIKTNRTAGVVAATSDSSYSVGNEHILPSLGDDDAFEAARKEINRRVGEGNDLAKIESVSDDGSAEVSASSPSDNAEYVTASYSG